jgi:hypothetical protein
MIKTNTKRDMGEGGRKIVDLLVKCVAKSEVGERRWEVNEDAIEGVGKCEVS